MHVLVLMGTYINYYLGRLQTAKFSWYSYFFKLVTVLSGSPLLPPIICPSPSLNNRKKHFVVLMQGEKKN